jgi:hypothetical protein
MEKTLWSIDFGSATGWQERGIIIFWKKRLFGGTHAVQFVGKYKKKGKKVTGTLSIEKTGKSPLPPLRGNIKGWPVKLAFEGDYGNEEIKLVFWDSKGPKPHLEKRMLFRCRNRKNLA